MSANNRNRLKTTVSAVASSGLGAFTISTASSGYRSFVAGDDGLTFDGVLITEGTTWEVRDGCVYTHSGTSLSRGTLMDSSTGSAIAFTSAAVVSQGAAKMFADMAQLAMAAVTPGGRLTLESGVPVSTTDQTAKTSIYYTPFVGNVVPLWDGYKWRPIEFSETTLALGTLTSGKPYDVFGYLSAGALVLESLAWTNGTTRATAVTLQDGRYCKSGDKTRLLLGTFYTTATTTTEDSVKHRFLSNVYNKVNRRVFVSVAGETTTSGTYNEIDNAGADTDPRIGIVSALPSSLHAGGTVATLSTVANDMSRSALFQNGSGGNGLWTYDLLCNTTTSPRVVGYGAAAVAPGYSYYSIWGSRFSGTGTITYGTAQAWGVWQC